MAEVSMTHLLLAQLRWLNNVVRPKELANKLFQIVDVTSRDTQHEVYLFLVSNTLKFTLRVPAGRLLRVSQRFWTTRHRPRRWRRSEPFC
jgi:hypothetical protein